ncbi:MAG TPA: hypothetical protein VGQ63_08250 [Pseudolabrys sp.]|jgi:hypothetical protein|nr:hypothetical protein [Pseudolabrys sp.]
MRIFTVLTLATLAAAGAGCSSGTGSVKTAEPHTFTYDCSGTGKGWGDCNEKADAQCGAHNYTVISQKGDADGKSSSGNSEMRRTLVVSCKH